MGMNVGSAGSGKRRGGAKPAMNVTPLVDVVLVLLIIFMVVTPLLTKQLWLNVPPKAEDTAPTPPPDVLPPIVVTLSADGVTKVNSEVVPPAELAQRVVRLVNARPDKVVFFDAASDVPYGRALEVMDAVRGGGVETLAVLAEELPAH